jgi:hypothetical protein
MKMLRCKAPVRIHVTATAAIVEFDPPMEIDVDRELSPGFTVADALRGRDDCFEPVPVDAATPAK